MLFLFCWIIYTGLRSPELFKAQAEIMPPVKDLVNDNHKILSKEQNTESPDIERLRDVERIRNYMEESEPYLDASLSLHDLSRQTKIPTRELSLAINHQLSKHFFDFVNEYRIEKAKQMLTNQEFKDHTILEILYNVGFNSKSSFNTAFKKHCGLTPTQYRKSNSLSAA